MEETVSIRAVNNYGLEDGDSCIYIKDITHITCDCEEDVVVKLLNESTKNKI